VVSMNGGMTAWRDAGYPLEKWTGTCEARSQWAILGRLLV